MYKKIQTILYQKPEEGSQPSSLEEKCNVHQLSPENQKRREEFRDWIYKNARALPEDYNLILD